MKRGKNENGLKLGNSDEDGVRVAANVFWWTLLKRICIQDFPEES